jgi:hypothetical protein
VLLKILKYDSVRDVAAYGGEVAPSPEMPPPVALAQFRKLPLYPDVMSVRRKSLSAICGGDFHQHMDMFSRQHAGDDLYAQVFALAAQAFGEP